MLARSRAALIALLGLSLTIAVIGAGVSPVVAQQSAAACSRVWLGHETEFEQAMRTGTVARMESVPIGVTKPQRARLDPSAPVASFTWKPLKPGYQKGYMESYRAEVAAYELDKMLDLALEGCAQLNRLQAEALALPYPGVLPEPRGKRK